MAPHSVRNYYNTEEARKRCSLTSPKSEDDYGISYAGEPIGKEAFFKSMGLRMKRVRYDRFFDGQEGQEKKRKIDVPVGIHLRKCSVVIQGEMCKICGRDFKCSTDVATHMKLRHVIEEDSFSNDIYSDLSSGTETDASRTHDSGSPSIDSTKVRLKKSRKHLSRMRLVLKLGREIMGDLFIKKKHLKSGIVNAPRQTCESLETKLDNYEHGSENASLLISHDHHKCDATNMQMDQVQTEVMDRVLISHTFCKNISQNESAREKKAEPHCRVQPLKTPAIEASVHRTNTKASGNDLTAVKKGLNTSDSSAVSTNNESLPKQNILRVHPFSITLASTCTITRVDNSAVTNNSGQANKSLSSLTRVSDPVKEVVRTSNNLKVPKRKNPLPKQSIHTNLPPPTVTVTHTTTYAQNLSATSNTKQANHRELCVTRVYNASADALGGANNSGIIRISSPLLESDVNRGLPSSITVSSSHSAAHLQNSTTSATTKETSHNKIARELLQNGSTEIRPNVFVRPVPREKRTTFVGQTSPNGNSKESLQTTNEGISSQSMISNDCQLVTGFPKEKSCDDDIQEVVRINRGNRISGAVGINHESPNRSEREILQVVDAITDMIRMEEKGLHLLAQKRNTEKTKSRISSKVDPDFDVKKNLQQENPRQSSSGNLKTPNMQKHERLKVHSCTSETSKENVPTTSHNSSLDEFEHYGFNHSSALPEIRSGNKMTSHHSHYSQQPHSRREPESKGSKTVILIDLVDD